MVSWKGKGTGSLGPNLLFPTHFDSFGLIQFEGEALNELPSSPLSWTDLLFWGSVCPWWSRQVPWTSLKIQDRTSHTPCHRIDA